MRHGPGGGPASVTHVSLHVGSDWSAVCHAYPDAGPILVVQAGKTRVNVLAQGRDAAATAGDVDFAWALVAAANDYLIEVERRYFAACDAEAGGGPVPEAA